MIIAFENKYSNIIMRECKIVQGQSSTNTHTHTQNATEKQNNNKSVLEPVEHQQQTAAAAQRSEAKKQYECVVKLFDPQVGNRVKLINLFESRRNGEIYSKCPRTKL